MDAKANLMRALTALGATEAVAYYSGGNDEGGVDRITLTLTDGETRELDPWEMQDEKWDVVKGRYVPNEGFDPNEKIVCDAMQAPVHSKYGGFGGEFYASGRVVATVATGEFSMDGEESSMSPYSDTF